MSRIVDSGAFDIVEMDNGDRVHVRQRLTASEQSELDRKLVHMEFDAATQQPKIVSGWHRQQIDICRAYVVGWDFKGDDGEAVPFSVDTIERLDQATVGEIARKVDALQKARTEETKKKVSRC